MKTILIADCGATKCEWIWLTNAERKSISTNGFNPNVHPLPHFHSSVHDVQKQVRDVTHLYFYGAGLFIQKNKTLVHGVLFEFFPQATITVEHDMMGAARGLCQGEEGIACILGTGSNACYFDGTTIVASACNLGWILSDEGSGCAIGKKWLVAFFRNELPSELMEKMKNEISFTREDFIRQLYHEQKGSAFLATFAKQVRENIAHPYCQQLVEESFDEFFVRHVAPFQQKVPVHFTGSIAFVFQEQLRRVAARAGYSLGRVIQHPLEGLVQFHQAALR